MLYVKQFLIFIFCPLYWVCVYYVIYTRRALLARILYMFFDHFAVCVVRYPTAVSNDAVSSKIYIIIITENIICVLYSILYTRCYYLFIGEKILGKTRHTHVDLSSLRSIVPFTLAQQHCSLSVYRI